MNVALIVVYAPGLGFLAVLLFLLIGLLAVVVFRRSLVIQREAFDHQREVNSRAFQLMGHVGKLRAAAAEERAFAFWADAFGDHRDKMYAARRIQNRFAGFAASFALLSYAVVFFVAGTVVEPRPDDVLRVLGGLRPGDGRHARRRGHHRERGGGGAAARGPGADPGRDPGGLRPEGGPGRAVRARSSSPASRSATATTARWSSTTSRCRVEPGEFVAIVGPSGSGKSTLLRLMLGFEAPSGGAVLYDEQDLGELDVSAVRRQCGVVLQDSQLFAGDILSNVVGSGLYTSDDAWAAIEMVGMDEEVASMPMGMFTVISDGAGTLSGGQRQRIALARALVARPRLVFLDEATSALDNLTQAQVMNSMRRMQATRVVIAHRLSTIQHADRIIVMQAGRIVEEGPYDELMTRDGVFKKLAERQLA